MPTVAHEQSGGIATRFTEELRALQGIEVATKTAMDNIHEATGGVALDWSLAFRLHQEDPDHVFTGLAKLIEATATFPHVLEQRIEIGTRAQQFAQDVTAAITTKSDGSRVEGSINPADARYSYSHGQVEYVGDDPDLPALFIRINSQKLGRVVGLKYSEYSHHFRTREDIARNWDINDGLDPLQVSLWHAESEDDRDKVLRRHPSRTGLLLSRAEIVFFEDSKKGFELPQPGEYASPDWD